MQSVTMNQELSLTKWQKKQAFLLYHFSSLKYLEGLRDRVNNIVSFAGGKINQSRIEGRDRFLHSAQWGNRDTTENWSNNAWQFLADFQLSVTEAIAAHPSNVFSVTGTHQCARGLSEYSMQWATLEEEEQFDAIFAEISNYARNIDTTMQKYNGVSWWSDFGFSLAWKEHASTLRTIPKFRVLPDVISDNGEIPPRTGVYIATDDPNASLQFAWNCSRGGKLIPSSTFNDLGLAALAAVGRSKLWVDGAAMREFVWANLSHPDLASDQYANSSLDLALAPSVVARYAFKARPTRWRFVEVVEEEFETVEEEVGPSSHPEPPTNQRFHAGAKCPGAGYYFTPARLDSRRWFAHGEAFPDVESSYGKTIWQWDTRQD